MNDYSILKLSNGEDLICRVVNKTESDIVIESPLKMETINRMTNSGVTESLSLTRWLQPFSDEKDYTIGKNSIVISVPASIGLSKYYEHVLNKLNKPVIRETVSDEIIEDDLAKMTDDEIIELIEDVKTRTIH